MGREDDVETNASLSSKKKKKKKKKAGNFSGGRRPTRSPLRGDVSSENNVTR